MKPSRRAVLALVLPAAVLTLPTASRAASPAELARNGEAALRQLYALQPRTKVLAARASAILVFPRIVKVGVLLAGGQSGGGVLLIKGRPRDYYNLSAASVGPQAGGQTFSYAMFLMNSGALDYLNKTDGWAIGTGPNVVVVDQGLAATLNSTTLRDDVYAIPFAATGLMAGVDLSGSKISHIKASS